VKLAWMGWALPFLPGVLGGRVGRVLKKVGVWFLLGNVTRSRDERLCLCFAWVLGRIVEILGVVWN